MERVTINRTFGPDIELQEWVESLDAVARTQGPKRVRELLAHLREHAAAGGIQLTSAKNTPYINTIHHSKEAPYPGDREIERKIKSILRWNAMAMVVRANRQSSGIGGHISTYASAATLYEVGFNHFFQNNDLVYIQGHATPGIYARAFLEGRLTERQLENFRRELAKGGGLSSYPHPWLMPDFWQFPTVSMGLGPILSIYQARFNRYLEDRGLKKTRAGKVWAFIGDGETDEPESLGSITLASREKLNNLIWVINCNLQRLDGPVRGNGKIIQELEAIFRGAGWNVIKVVWGSNWDPLLDQDAGGKLLQRMNEVVDGQYQKYKAMDGKYVREHFFGAYPETARLVSSWSDEAIWALKRGGHDPIKVFNAYHEAVHHGDGPTVVLAKTIKGYGMGDAGEGKNTAHQQKKLKDEELRAFRDRFDIPITDKQLAEVAFYKPSEQSREMKYLKERRRELGGFVPKRTVMVEALKTPNEDLFTEFYTGTDGREVSTTMVFVRILAKLLKDEKIGKLIVPIVPDEARTFGMEALFRQVGIWSHVGQLYEPVDSETLLYYKESQDGQILEEGITEAGSMSSFIAAGTAYATHGIHTIPFFIYYSMFGLQRIGDLIWAAGDQRTRGFLVGGTAGRTTLAGEGLQHQDGHSHLLAYPVPNLVTYDPAFAFELAVIIRDGIRRMYEQGESIFYYVTVGNENYAQPSTPKHLDAKSLQSGILKGMYRFKPTSRKKVAEPRAHLFGSGAILNEAVKAQQILEEEFDVATDVWSITSFKELHRDGEEIERWNRMHPTEKPKIPYVTECLTNEVGVFVVVSDYVKALPESIARWFPKPPAALGTDGFGRSEARAELRDFFEVDARHIVVATLFELGKEKKIKPDVVEKAMKRFKINSEKANPLRL